MSSWDQWFWGDESIVTREEKSTGYLKQLNKTDNSTLRYYRYLHALWFIINEAISYYEDGLNYTTKYKFKTDWGWWIYGTYVITIAYAHYRHDSQGKALGEDTSSPFNLWKICSSLFSFVVIDHLIITLFYWGLVHGGLDPPHSYWRLMKHSAPFPLMMIDFSMSNIMIEYRHIVATIFYVGCYSSLLISYTLTNDDTIYGFAHLESATSWAMVGGIILASVFSHLVFATISAARHRNKLATSSNLEVLDDAESLVLIVIP